MSAAARDQTVGTCTIDGRDQTVRLDPPAAGLLGLAEDQWQGDLADFIALGTPVAPDGRALRDVPESATRAAAVRDAVQAGRPLDLVWRISRAEGRGWTRIQLSPIAPHVSQGVVSDVTVFVRRGRFLDAVVEGLLPDQLGIADTDIRYVALSSQTQAELQAFHGVDIQAGDLTFKDVPPVAAELIRAMWRRAIDGDDWTDEFVAPETPPRSSRLRMFPLFDEGELLGAAALNRDVTELVHARETLARSRAAMLQFVTLASHDLNTPLRGVRTYADEAGRALDAGDHAGAQEMLDQLDVEVARMQALLDDLMRWSEVRAREVPHERVELDEVARAAIGRAVDARPEATVRVTSDPLPPVLGDEQSLLELLVNLIDNGLRYNDSDIPSVHVTAETVGARVHVRLSDNGIGIPEQHHDRVFEIFQRLHARNAYGGGTGAGLTLAAQIAEQHDGRIVVESTPGEGSVFTVTLLPHARLVGGDFAI